MINNVWRCLGYAKTAVGISGALATGANILLNPINYFTAAMLSTAEVTVAAFSAAAIATVGLHAFFAVAAISAFTVMPSLILDHCFKSDEVMLTDDHSPAISNVECPALECKTTSCNDDSFLSNVRVEYEAEAIGLDALSPPAA